ncbi:MAG: imidazoleglycerol-phosphate dehydratase HisB [Spirochaetota bacterium]
MRKSKRERTTKETQIELSLDLDGTGTYTIDTPIGFFNHMLELFAKHGRFDLAIKAKGDVNVDFHHTVEDVGIVLGEAVAEALGDKKGIERYANVSLPMDETLVDVALDISGRPYAVYKADGLARDKVGEFDTELAADFFRAFAVSAKMTMHVSLSYGTNAHHIIEAMFKASAVALRRASRITNESIPSTKGIL